MSANVTVKNAKTHTRRRWEKGYNVLIDKHAHDCFLNNIPEQHY